MKNHFKRPNASNDGLASIVTIVLSLLIILVLADDVKGYLIGIAIAVGVQFLARFRSKQPRLPWFVHGLFIALIVGVVLAAVFTLFGF